MANTINYKCPNCGGIIEFDSATQSMKCPYCDSEFSVRDFDYKDDFLNWKTDEGYHLYHCDSCGAELISDDTAASMKCPYCDNPVIITDRLSGEYKPDLIIPFKLDKNAAKTALSNHFKDKKLLPRVFSTDNHLDEIKGIYVPFWLFDTEVNASANYEMKNTSIWSDARLQYTETMVYNATRTGTLSFNNVPVDGSEKMDNTMMESLEPFDYSQLLPFKTAYLAGYMADKYDVNSNETVDRIRQRVCSSACDYLDSTISGYDSIHRINQSAYLTNTKIKYALLPVWILNTTWHGKRYIFAMNGQTGKFIGDLPIDNKLVWKYRLLYGLLYGGGIFILSYFLTNIL